MRYFIFFFVLIGLCWSSPLYAQKDSQFEVKDKELFEQYLQKLEEQQWTNLDTDAQVIAIGQLFIGTPYIAKTLEIQGPEQLVINLRGLDCTTYVENVLAFKALAQNSDTSPFETFAKHLQTIRYRDGQLMGYSSRLHYFSEWIQDNEQKGLVQDLTSSLGGIEEKRSINFMGQHPQFYPQLSSAEEVKRIQQIEAKLSAQSFCYIPTSGIPHIQSKIKSGDVLALVTSIDGLDVTHTGFALWKEGKLHLMHASTSGEVVISDKPLVQYLKGIKNNIGIQVVRPL